MINDVAQEEHTVDAEFFQPLHTKALASIEARLGIVRSVLSGSKEHGALSQEESAKFQQAKETIKQIQQTVRALAAKGNTDKATITTQDILRCAQWAKKLEIDDNCAELTFHNDAIFRASVRMLGPNGAIGHLLNEHERIERFQYNANADNASNAQTPPVTPASDPLEVKDAQLNIALPQGSGEYEFFDSMTWTTLKRKPATD